ncbi:3428_t:CDS:2 [Diversispora eburnea]|uniref:3428_t:CDS:1 n=1 Tax=Diversispora eburnea TaxID=1213867 RepID=A0A9N8YUM9_9GLOM|nr:3428_t:CDS:2 [Diversispora eburnea]
MMQCKNKIFSNCRIGRSFESSKPFWNQGYHEYHENLPLKLLLPFPPEINAKDLIAHRESPDGTKKLTTRAPNAFIIFRKQFVKTARDEGHFLPMTVISSMASTAWENEREEVRVEYKRIAREAHIQRKAFENNNHSTSPNENINLNSNLYDNTEQQQQYSSPFLMKNHIQQNNLYNDDNNWSGTISNFTASPSNSLSDFTSNASSSPSIASPSIISLDTPTAALARSDFTDFTDFTIINNTTQNNYEIMDFPSIIYNNDTIMQPLVMMQ